MKAWIQGLWRRVRPAEDVEADAYTEIQPEPGGKGGGEHEGAAAGARPLLARLTGPSRREQELEELRNGYRELVDLIRSIREHLQGESQTRQALVGGLQQLQQTMRVVDQGHRDTLTALDRMVERSERRWMFVVALLVVLLLVTLGAAGFLVLHLERPPAPAVPMAADVAAPIKPPPQADSAPMAVPEEGNPAAAEPEPAPGTSLIQDEPGQDEKAPRPPAEPEASPDEPAPENAPADPEPAAAEERPAEND